MASFWRFHCKIQTTQLGSADFLFGVGSSIQQKGVYVFTYPAVKIAILSSCHVKCNFALPQYHSTLLVSLLKIVIHRMRVHFIHGSKVKIQLTGSMQGTVYLPIHLIHTSKMYGSVNIPLSNGSSRWDDCQITIPFPRAPNTLGVSDAQHPRLPKSRMTAALIPIAQLWLLICCWLSSWLPGSWQWSWPRVSSSFVAANEKTEHGKCWEPKNIHRKERGSDTKKKRSSVSKCFEDVVDVLQFYFEAGDDESSIHRSCRRFQLSYDDLPSVGHKKYWTLHLFLLGHFE